MAPNRSRSKSGRKSQSGPIMLTIHNPVDVLPVVGPLSWGLELPAPRRLLYISGQVGADADGRIGDGLLEQAALAFANVGAVLRSAGLTPGHIVRTGLYFTRHVEMTPDLQAAFNLVRTGFLGDHRPTSTFLYVYGLADPRWLFEVDAVAAEFDT
jgi:enamine deaminase RidA (YjgF/YER057c/UK114 family)